MDAKAFPVPDKWIRGPERGDATEMLPTVQGYHNPGPTANLRGVEANTDRSKGFPVVVPEPSGPRLECG